MSHDIQYYFERITVSVRYSLRKYVVTGTSSRSTQHAERQQSRSTAVYKHFICTSIAGYPIEYCIEPTITNDEIATSQQCNEQQLHPKYLSVLLAYVSSQSTATIAQALFALILFLSVPLIKRSSCEPSPLSKSLDNMARYADSIRVRAERMDHEHRRLHGTTSGAKLHLEKSSPRTSPLTDRRRQTTTNNKGPLEVEFRVISHDTSGEQHPIE